MLVLTRRTDESILIGDEEVVVRILEIRGNRVRIGIEAPANVSIRRDEAPPREFEFQMSRELELVQS
ncbi:carbon storage regulator [bacterium]|nr:carbon storage regulator [bacterium]